MDWRRQLRFDALVPLVRSGNPAIRYFAGRDLDDDDGNNTNAGEQALTSLWELGEVKRILKRQLDSGAWKYPGGGHMRSPEDYNQIETYRMLGQLVEKYGLNRGHHAMQRAAEYLFSRQTGEGDFRGIYGNQYSPNYSAAIMELLIKAGYAGDPRIKRGFSWLLSIRQADGGWVIPLRTGVGKRGRSKFDPGVLRGEPIRPDVSKPFSHLVTGVVLRAFAAHPDYRKAAQARAAGRLLASRFFEADKYPDRRAPGFWTSFSYPFWFTDLLSSLDSLSLMGFGIDDDNDDDDSSISGKIRAALDWFVARQQPTGLWVLPTRMMKRAQDRDLWITLAVCRVFKRFYKTG
ncbi:hypothetical protein [Nitrososphaera sp.]|uniref:hypothetical protein n=1 Tax=Nitrososphaera sp. TaxID=1971748 RepID=UPI00307D5130